MQCARDVHAPFRLVGASYNSGPSSKSNNSFLLSSFLETLLASTRASRNASALRWWTSDALTRQRRAFDKTLQALSVFWCFASSCSWQLPAFGRRRIPNPLDYHSVGSVPSSVNQKIASPGTSPPHRFLHAAQPTRSGGVKSGILFFYIKDPSYLEPFTLRRLKVPKVPKGIEKYA